MESTLQYFLAFTFVCLCVGQDYDKHHFGPAKDDRKELCEGIECPTGERCIVGDNHEPKCVCSQMCTADYSPLCATNGRTYSNACYMETEACLNGVELQVIMYRDCQFVFICGGAIVGLSLVTVVLLLILVVRCCRRRETKRQHLAFIVDDYTSEAFIHRTSDIYKPTTIKTKSVQYDKVPILGY